MVDNNRLKGLGGWLILVGLGVLIRPIILLLTIFPIFKSIFENGMWEALTAKGSELYIPYFSSLLAAELACNIIFFLASIYLFYLFFSKNYLFPKVYIAISVASLVFIPLDSWLVNKVFPDVSVFDPETTKEFILVLISCIIWIPYMLLSKRVKITFVENMPEKSQLNTERVS
ncbi:DUF2569 domain-containing protein [Marinomonas posidonica]|uniref:DUF2569 domain-containing protein n=1 Tax=Marinomonas posidonica (strain CECT 7376 / NCIMB 14433 / IVIA-Po-181) TaxID=491952 RepID=F6CUY3_MARPP|nr:DUF2569 domain-containing protein [Marinomonas posidonica]AEF55309.1 Protein of unknown function DUF2569 [Marinomonas posidonica IVIA-Po-181]